MCGTVRLSCSVCLVELCGQCVCGTVRMSCSVCLVELCGQCVCMELLE